MDRLRLAVSLPVFQQPLKTALKSAAATGATGVLVDTRHQLKVSEFSESARRHLGRYLEELGLVLAVTTFPTRRSFSDRQGLEARVEATCQAMTFARSLGSDLVTLWLGPLPDGAVDEAGCSPRDLLVDVLNDLARHGNHVGTLPALGASAVDVEELKALLAKIDQGPIGLDFDPAGIVGQGRNPVEAYRELHDRVCHLRVRDMICEAGGPREVPMGDGEVAWDEMLAVLDEAEYCGWLTAERSAGGDPAGDVARAVAFVRAIAAG
ncbi:MAG: sugar phosphate isomerase/epimerase family protein [Planctomycetaceae bacterium]|jgi:sugar phosphate isomerase/epimerase|nr:sugar phosphate isomerase/epimerase family protein [Planctomycetaceae bacterium]